MKSVLVIDDDPLIRKTLSSYISKKGFEAVVAEDGEEGIQKYEEHIPDLVILDIRLPDVDGLEVLGRIREKNPNASIIIMTAYDDMKTTSMFDAEADDADTNSLQVIGKAGLKALKDDNNIMVITAEGFHRAVEASGWGIGFYGVRGDVSDTGKSSSAGGGGTGFAKNEVSSEDRPWVSGYAGVISNSQLEILFAE